MLTLLSAGHRGSEAKGHDQPCQYAIPIWNGPAHIFGHNQHGQKDQDNENSKSNHLEFLMVHYLGANENLIFLSTYPVRTLAAKTPRKRVLLKIVAIPEGLEPSTY